MQILDAVVRKLQSENAANNNNVDAAIGIAVPMLGAIMIVLVNAVAFGFFKCHQNFLACVQKHRFADFDGRSSRREYVGFYVAHILFVFDLLIVDFCIMFLGIPPLLTIIYGIVTAVPHFAVVVRRLHDVGVSGWALLVVFVPGLAAFLMPVLCFIDGQAGTNAWGPNPKPILNEGLGDNYLPMLIPTAEVMYSTEPAPSFPGNGSAALVHNSDGPLHDPELGLHRVGASLMHQQGDLNET